MSVAVHRHTIGNSSVYQLSKDGRVLDFLLAHELEELGRQCAAALAPSPASDATACASSVPPSTPGQADRTSARPEAGAPFFACVVDESGGAR